MQVHAEEPSALSEPAGHGVQLGEPAVENVPAGHGWQGPPAVLNVPAGQSKHWVWPVLLSVLLPAGQAVQLAPAVGAHMLIGHAGNETQSPSTRALTVAGTR